MLVHTIHPFPARMAPEIALEELRELPTNALVLDPMVGSGTVMRVTAERGYRGIGFDLDPLSVLISKVWTTEINTNEVIDTAEVILQHASSIKNEAVHLPWIDNDSETEKFVDYWFGDEQKRDLRLLSYLLYGIEGTIFNALRVAFSRLIITKDKGASLARDVSHSRPHRVSAKTSFDVMSEFRKSVHRLARTIRPQTLCGRVLIREGDARNMTVLAEGSVDAVITSPPYLNAIDYMRGHRLALVWFGYKISKLRGIRSISIGAERAPDSISDPEMTTHYCKLMGHMEQLPSTEHKMVKRFVIDMAALLKEIKRVVHIDGKVVLVVGNTCIKNVFIDNATGVSAIAEDLGFKLLQRRERELPASHRYLPPPTISQSSNFQKRLRTETILTIQR